VTRWRRISGAGSSIWAKLLVVSQEMQRAILELIRQLRGVIELRPTFACGSYPGLQHVFPTHGLQDPRARCDQIGDHLRRHLYIYRLKFIYRIPP